MSALTIPAPTTLATPNVAEAAMAAAADMTTGATTIAMALLLLDMTTIGATMTGADTTIGGEIMTAGTMIGGGTMMIDDTRVFITPGRPSDSKPQAHHGRP